MNHATTTYACTLRSDDAHRRLPQVRALTDRLRRRERVDDRVLLAFHDDGHTLDLVREFVRDESQCCSFFEFDVGRRDGHILVELRAPAQAGHVLDAAMESFDPDIGDREQLLRYGAHVDQGLVEPGTDPVDTGR